MLNLSWMHPAIPRLLELQTIDQHIAALRAELDAFPKRVREADLKLTGARNAVTAAREAHTHGLAERKKFELDVQQWKERAKKYREQSAAVKTNEAYKALQHEITNAEAEVAKAEDRHGQCRGCGMRVLPHILQQLVQDANDELFRCESCGLILYSLEPIPAPNPETGNGSAASSASSSS